MQNHAPQKRNPLSYLNLFKQSIRQLKASELEQAEFYSLIKQLEEKTNLLLDSENNKEEASQIQPILGPIVAMEVFFEILRYLPLHDLAMLRLVSKEFKRCVDNYIDTYCKSQIINLILSKNAMGAIYAFRETDYYKNLLFKLHNNTLSTTNEIVLYALTCDNINTIDDKKLQKVIAEMSNEINNLKEKLNLKNEKNVAEFNQKIRLRNSLELTYWVIKRNIVLDYIREIKKSVNRIDDKNIKDDMQIKLLNDLSEKLKQEDEILYKLVHKSDESFMHTLDCNCLDALISEKIVKLDFSNSYTFCNLAAANFINFNFSGYDLYGVNLENAKLGSIFFVDGTFNFKKANLKNANLLHFPIYAKCFDTNILTANINSALLIPNLKMIENLNTFYEINKEIIDKTEDEFVAKIAKILILNFKSFIASNNKNEERILPERFKSFKKLSQSKLFANKNEENTSQYLEYFSYFSTSKPKKPKANHGKQILETYIEELENDNKFQNRLLKIKAKYQK